MLALACGVPLGVDGADPGSSAATARSEGGAGFIGFRGAAAASAGSAAIREPSTCCGRSCAAVGAGTSMAGAEVAENPSLGRLPFVGRIELFVNQAVAG